MKNKKLKIDCSDWMKGWGYGYHHIGKLEIDELNNRFIWTGHCAGRHGNTWNKGSKVIFTVIDGHINIIEAKGTLPEYNTVFKAVDTLLRMQLQK